MSTYRLNTIFVGLESVAEGRAEAGALAVTWTKPSKEKARQVADQARIFACTSALFFATDIFDRFIREIVQERWLGFSAETIEIAMKSRTRSRELGGDYSVAERVETICAELKIDEPVSVAAMELLSKWRNRLAHSAEHSGRLDDERQKVLLAGSDYIHAKYSHLDIKLALRNFSSRTSPVPKEVTTLAAIATNLSRKIDEAAIRRVAATSEEVARVAEVMLRSYFSPSPERTLSPWAELSNSWSIGKTRRKDMLKKFLAQSGITESKDMISAILPQHFFDDVVALDRTKFAERFGIIRPE